MTAVYLRARHLPQVVVAILILQFGLATLGARAVTFSSADRYEAISLTALGQFIVVTAALQTCRTGTALVEETSSRRLIPQRLLVLSLVIVVCLGSAVVVATTASPEPAVVGTTGPWVIVRNQAGLLGLGLLATRFIDPRIAAAVPASLVVLPFVLQRGESSLHAVWAFVLMPQMNPVAATTAAALLLVGSVTQLLQGR